jgi:hypothetical protein
VGDWGVDLGLDAPTAYDYEQFSHGQAFAMNPLAEERRMAPPSVNSPVTMMMVATLQLIDSVYT